MKNVCLIGCILFCSLTGQVNAQITTLVNLYDTNGKLPWGDVTLSHGMLYGITARGGHYDSGCVFSLDTNGIGFKKLFDFSGTTGGLPRGSLIISGNVLYGMTLSGAAHGYGSVFSIHTDGSNFKDLLDFNNINGSHPWGSLILSGNELFGMSFDGGTTGYGCIFSIDTNGHNYKTIHSFINSDGAAPIGSLTLVGSKLFGMTYLGGTNSFGVLFSVDSDGRAYKVLLNFSDSSGNGAGVGSLVNSGKKLYGMEYMEGPHKDGLIFSIDTDGSNYKTMFNFNGPDGQWPFGTMNLVGGVLYGMTSSGGTAYGVIFSIDTSGNNFTDLLDLNYADGSGPSGSLTISGKNFYGMTVAGGTMDSGTIFRFADVDMGITNITTNEGAANVYPNPNNGVFTIAFRHPELVSGSQTMEVYNILGEKIYNGMLKPVRTVHPGGQVQHDYTIDLSTQPNGVYLYRVIDEKSNLLGEGKVVIER